MVIGGLADVQADAGRRADACATYNEGLGIYESMRRRSRLTGLDLHHNVRILKERQKVVCGG